MVDYLGAIEHLPNGATLVFQQCDWMDYEQVLAGVCDRPGLRISYDRGTLEVISPLPEHEAYTRFVDDVVRVTAEALDVPVEKLGGATWRRRTLDRGLEPDACYFVGAVERIVGRRRIDAEAGTLPDIAVEIDVTNESLRKLAIYAALGVPEVWRYDATARRVIFYALAGGDYVEIAESRFLARLTPALLAAALEQSATGGQTAALKWFRQRWRETAGP